MSSTTLSATAQHIAEQQKLQAHYPESVAHNARQTYYVRSTGLSIAGSVAGVLGLTNLHGLWFYALSVLLVNAAVLLVNAKGKPARYLQNHSVLDGAQENAFSFVLWWTFWYGIVHVYD